MSRTVEVSGVPLRVHEWGEDGGSPLLFVHHLGINAGGRSLAEAAPLLAQDGFHVVAPDLPGFGGSPAVPPEGYDTPALADLLAGLLDAFGSDRAAVVGLSWGGIIASELTGRHPDRVSRLVLLDGGHGDLQEDPDFEEQPDLAAQVADSRRGVQEFRFPSQDAMLELARKIEPRWSPALEAAWVRAFHEVDGELRMRVQPETHAAVTQALCKRRPSEALPALGRSGVPVLLLLATEPPDIEERQQARETRFRARVPQAEVRRLPGVPHQMVSALGPELAPLLRGWLQGP